MQVLYEDGQKVFVMAMCVHDDAGTIVEELLVIAVRVGVRLVDGLRNSLNAEKGQISVDRFC